MEHRMRLFTPSKEINDSPAGPVTGETIQKLHKEGRLGFKILSQFLQGHKGVTYKLGRWTPLIPDIALCKRGYHFCQDPSYCEEFISHLTQHECHFPLRYFAVEVDNSTVQGHYYVGKFVAPRLRLILELTSDEWCFLKKKLQ